MMNDEIIKKGDKCSIIGGSYKGGRGMFIGWPKNNNRKFAVVHVEGDKERRLQTSSLVFDIDVRPNTSNKRKKKEEQEEEQDNQQHQEEEIDPPPVEDKKGEEISLLNAQIHLMCNVINEMADRLAKIEMERK